MHFDHDAHDHGRRSQRGFCCIEQVIERCSHAKVCMSQHVFARKTPRTGIYKGLCKFSYERFGGKTGMWWIQQRGTLRRARPLPNVDALVTSVDTPTCCPTPCPLWCARCRPELESSSMSPALDAAGSHAVPPPPPPPPPPPSSPFTPTQELASRTYRLRFRASHEFLRFWHVWGGSPPGVGAVSGRSIGPISDDRHDCPTPFSSLQTAGLREFVLNFEYFSLGDCPYPSPL